MFLELSVARTMFTISFFIFSSTVAAILNARSHLMSHSVISVLWARAGSTRPLSMWLHRQFHVTYELAMGWELTVRSLSKFLACRIHPKVCLCRTQYLSHWFCGFFYSQTDSENINSMETLGERPHGFLLWWVPNVFGPTTFWLKDFETHTRRIRMYQARFKLRRGGYDETFSGWKD